ncbi:MAG: ABC transporter ATP-binding protein, partial [Bdellovibrionales bacterium]|nr:ABC transporter ATP-binding protein [Bdellovibrionales bacterium]
DLDIEAGEAVCIVGESGSGKSTLLHILGTLDRADKGSLFYQAEDLGKKSDSELAKFRNEELGFVFQFHHLMSEFTALENVMMPAKIAGVGSKEARERAEDLFGLLGITHRKTHYPSQMSGGEQQRVAIARALMRRPKILLADEPTGNLDGQNTQLIRELFFRLQRELGLALVVVTHDQSMASHFYRVLRLVDGQWEHPELSVKSEIP